MKMTANGSTLEDDDQARFKVFVGGLAAPTNSDSLRKHFSKFGVVDDANVVYDHVKGRSRCFGYVKFRDEQTVNLVLESQHCIDEKIVEAKKCLPRDVTNKMRFKKVFVGGLGNEMTDDQLRQLFTQYGAVTEAIVVRDADKRSKGFGFVAFESEESARDLVRRRVVHFNNRQIEIRAFTKFPLGLPLNGQHGCASHAHYHAPQAQFNPAQAHGTSFADYSGCYMHPQAYSNNYCPMGSRTGNFDASNYTAQSGAYRNVPMHSCMANCTCNQAASSVTSGGNVAQPQTQAPNNVRNTQMTGLWTPSAANVSNATTWSPTAVSNWYGQQGVGYSTTNYQQTPTWNANNSGTATQQVSAWNTNWNTAAGNMYAASNGDSTALNNAAQYAAAPTHNPANYMQCDVTLPYRIAGGDATWSGAATPTKRVASAVMSNQTTGMANSSVNDSLAINSAMLTTGPKPTVSATHMLAANNSAVYSVYRTK